MKTWKALLLLCRDQAPRRWSWSFNAFCDWMNQCFTTLPVKKTFVLYLYRQNCSVVSRTLSELQPLACFTTFHVFLLLNERWQPWTVRFLDHNISILLLYLLFLSETEGAGDSSGRCAGGPGHVARPSQGHREALLFHTTCTLWEVPGGELHAHSTQKGLRQEANQQPPWWGSSYNHCQICHRISFSHTINVSSGYRVVF